MYISLGLQNTLHFNTIDWNQLIFSDQINDYNNNIQSSNVTRPPTYSQNSFLDPSFGLLITRHSLLNRKSNNTSFIGFAWHHIYPPFQSFFNNQIKETRIPQKLTVHGQYIGTFNKMATEAFNFWKISYRHSWQGNNVIQKDELGLTLSFSNNVQLEAGIFYRISRQDLKRNNSVLLMNESITPLLRIRTGIGSSTGIEISYSYDYNISKLNNINTLATHELSLNLYYFRPKSKVVCPGQGKWGNNRKWNNVILNKGKYRKSTGDNDSNW